MADVQRLQFGIAAAYPDAGGKRPGRGVHYGADGWLDNGCLCFIFVKLGSVLPSWYDCGV